MKVSESIVNDLLFEVDFLTFRIRNIKLSLKTSSNRKLRERLINENISIFERVNEINKTAVLLKKMSKDKISFSNLLIEKSQRTINENKTERNLFFL